MIRLDIRSNIADVQRRFDKLSEEVKDKALVRALNRTGTTVRAAATREIRAEYPGLKAAAIREAMRIRNATRGDLTMTIEVRGHRLKLIDFSARQTKRGVSVRVKGRSVITHAFIQKMRSGHQGVFARVHPGSKGNPRFRFGKGSRIARKGADLPIVELTTLSLPRAFMHQKIQRTLKRLALDTVVKNYRSELNYQSIRASR